MSFVMYLTKDLSSCRICPSHWQSHFYNFVHQEEKREQRVSQECSPPPPLSLSPFASLLHHLPDLLYRQTDSLLSSLCLSTQFRNTRVIVCMDETIRRKLKTTMFPPHHSQLFFFRFLIARSYSTTTVKKLLPPMRHESNEDQLNIKGEYLPHTITCSWTNGNHMHLSLRRAPRPYLENDPIVHS